ncbi:hypothetical protein GHT06_013593 [Daphnia sinensis]|uniref:18S rRNA (pseudouridine-N1)-methyltransferase n=1 Tax=Daphnia sinensis TaxID=1820382 RepID=A0AAD5PVF1_9CRUS|nr:hypothetical protein GHT06_013593 [Daphnia sinensis]
MSNKRKISESEEADYIAKPPKILSNIHLRNQEKRLIVILEQAQLESAKIGKDFELLNCDDHIGFLKKHNREPSSCRPDITHQCLLMLLDSPLNRAGLLQVYIHTAKNVLIEVNPQTRIPRTYTRFAGLMVQLLHKMSIKAANGPMKLLKVIKNPIQDHLPVGCRKIATTFSSTKLVKPRDLVLPDEPIAIVVEISISQYPLSAALTCSKLCSAFEEVWGIH